MGKKEIYLVIEDGNKGRYFVCKNSPFAKYLEQQYSTKIMAEIEIEIMDYDLKLQEIAEKTYNDARRVAVAELQ